MASLGEIVVIAEGMRNRFGADTRQMLVKEIAAHLREDDIEAAKFWERVVDVMAVLDAPAKLRRRAFDVN